MNPRTIRVAIVGVGNCACALVQGVAFYRDANPDDFVPGLMHVELGGYHVRDLEFVAAFDVNSAKVGKCLSEAIWAAPNNTYRFSEVKCNGLMVQRGPTLDGLGKYLGQTIAQSEETPVDVVQSLRESRAEVLISYLPVGSEEATQFYAQCALDAGCAFINCVPSFIASKAEWSEKFARPKVCR